MKKVQIIFLLLFSFQFTSYSQKSENLAPNLVSVKKWFSAWELVSKDILKIETHQSVEFVFFDKEYVYSTSNSTIPKGEIIIGPSFLKKKLIWKKALHEGKITLPDNQIVPIGMMAFASSFGDKHAFFIMPLPKFWQEMGIESKELGLENLITGVFLHEFAHTQQMQNFGKQISFYEKQYKFDVDLSDDIIQDYFKKDSVYVAGFKKEVAFFYDVAHSGQNINKALEEFKNRQSQYFKGDRVHLKELDNFFLTMEGLGQYLMYVWFTHPKGANIAKEVALKGTRRGGKYWSQEEGFALFLVLEQFAKPQWAKKMFGREVITVLEVIEKEVKEKR